MNPARNVLTLTQHSPLSRALVGALLIPIAIGVGALGVRPVGIGLGCLGIALISSAKFRHM